MEGSNPFSLMFGEKPYAYIDRGKELDTAINSICSGRINNSLLITGARGAGKTVFFGQVIRHFEEKED